MPDLLSSIKFNGSHYIVVGFSSPTWIAIPKNIIVVHVPMESNILELQIKFEPKTKKGDSPIPSPMNFTTPLISSDFLNENYSQFFVFIPICGATPEQNRNQQIMAKHVETNKEYFINIAIQGVNKFISFYRLFSGEYNVTPILNWLDLGNLDYIFLYNKNSPEEKKSNFEVFTTPVYTKTFREEMVIPPEIVEQITNNLAKNIEISIADELMLNTYCTLIKEITN